MRRALLATAAALGAVVLATATPPAFAQPDAPSGPDRYATQKIDWKPCFPQGVPLGLPLGSDRLECGSFTAPRDWAHPGEGPDITIAVSRLRPATGTAKSALFTNPGGPGAEGRWVPLLFLATHRQRMLDSQDIYGIDVRGTGDSTNANCEGGSTTGLELDPRVRDRGQLDLLMDSAELVARMCQHGTGDLGPLVRTDETVKDLDLLRALIGQEKINWLGYSGGTWLGAYYATYFPQRVGRFVLDANTAFTEPWQTVFDLQPLGFQRRYEQDFLPWAATYNSMLDLGSTPAQVNQTYEQLRAALAKEPLNLGGGLALYPVDLDILTIKAMYSKLSFQPFAEQVKTFRDAAASRGRPEQRAPISAAATEQARTDVRQERETRGHSGGLARLGADSGDATFLHVLCNDTPWQGSRESLVADSQRQGEAYPLVGWGTLADPCISWHRPNVSLLTPNGQGVPPILMVQNQHDPATPYEGGVLARDKFAGARLLTVIGEGDHTTYSSGSPNTCVNDEVENYLVGGVVPARDTSCPGNPIPAPTPTLPTLPVPIGVGGLTGTPEQIIATLTALVDGITR